jgi:hypothetical protein
VGFRAWALRADERAPREQCAGAIGIVFINDVVEETTFTAIPRIDKGVIPAPWGDGKTSFTLKIPACIVLHDFSSIIQEGATFVMCFAPKGFPGTPPEPWQVGFVMVPPQEGRSGMSKETATALMHEFLHARRKERGSEQELRASGAGTGAEEEALRGKEWLASGGGGLFDSLNPLKQLTADEIKDKKLKGAVNVDDKMRQAMLSGLEKLAGEGNASWLRNKAVEHDEWWRARAREQQAALRDYLPEALASMEIAAASPLKEKGQFDGIKKVFRPSSQPYTPAHPGPVSAKRVLFFS